MQRSLIVDGCENFIGSMQASLACGMISSTSGSRGENIMKVFEAEIDRLDSDIANLLSSLKGMNRKCTSHDLSVVFSAVSMRAGLNALLQVQREFDAGTIEWKDVEARKLEVGNKMIDEQVAKWDLESITK